MSYRYRTVRGKKGPATLVMWRGTLSTPNHHLWRKPGGVWMIHYTLHTANGIKRVRRSLGTYSVTEARKKRDKIIGAFLRES